eukprot:m.110745 g.110745  ORF g.110745 m.110745 type:complete len:349 (+) comp9347_c0_seq1:1434-2480(+)
MDPIWPERQYCVDFMERTRDSTFLSVYLNDYWNALDWISYILLLTAAVISFFVSRQDVDGTQNENARSATLERVHSRTLVMGLIFLWTRFLGYLRTLKSIGPFIVMLTRMSTDVRDFLVLYVDLLIPFSVAFVVIFSSLTDFASIDVAMMSLFRMTLVDYDYASIDAVDNTMGPFLVALWLFISGVLFVNLFIAMMSKRFDDVYDKADKVALMQRAEAVLEAEMWLSDSALQRTRMQFQSMTDEQDVPIDYIEHPYQDDDTEVDVLTTLREDILSTVQSTENRIARLEQMVASVCERLNEQSRRPSQDPVSNHASPAVQRRQLPQLIAHRTPLSQAMPSNLRRDDSFG